MTMGRLPSFLQPVSWAASMDWHIPPILVQKQTKATFAASLELWLLSSSWQGVPARGQAVFQPDLAAAAFWGSQGWAGWAWGQASPACAQAAPGWFGASMSAQRGLLSHIVSDTRLMSSNSSV